MAMASGDVERAYRMNASAAGIKVSNFPWMDDDALFVFVFVAACFVFVLSFWFLISRFFYSSRSMCNSMG